MMTIETPILSSVLTVYTKCSVNPPVSPSKIIGLLVTSIISSTVLRREVISTTSISGLPREVESQREEHHIASNCFAPPFSATIVFSTISPVNPECASITVAIPLVFRTFLSLFLLTSGVESSALALLSNSSYLSSLEYGYSTSCPPYEARTSHTSSRMLF